MPKQAKALGPLAVRNLTGQGLHFVGEVPGLALQVLQSGAKTWILRMKIGDKRRDMGLSVRQADVEGTAIVIAHKIVGPLRSAHQGRARGFMTVEVPLAWKPKPQPKPAAIPLVGAFDPLWPFASGLIWRDDRSGDFPSPLERSRYDDELVAPGQAVHRALGGC